MTLVINRRLRKMSDESDVGSSRDRRKRKALSAEESSSDSDSSIETTRRKRRKHKSYIRESDSESDSSIEVVHKKRIGVSMVVCTPC